MNNVSCEIICVGTELLLGDIVNTNAQYISRGLAQLGINVFYQTVVGDNPSRLGQVLAIAKDRSDIVITTGGLGPTYDDLTKETVAASFGRKVIMHEESLRDLEAFFAHINRLMTENNKKQAMMPEGCIVLKNPQGTAPGCIIEGDDGKIAIMMPGPPREMEPMFNDLVRPYLRKLSEDILVSRVIRVIGIGESAMEMKLLDMMESMTNPTLAPYAKSGECIVRVTAKAHDETAAYALIDPAVDEVRRRLGAFAYGVDIDSLEQHIIELLYGNGKTAAFAEVSTGGLAAKRLFDVQGAQNVLKLGITASSVEDMRAALDLGLPKQGDEPDLGQIAGEMARAIRRVSGAHIGVGIIRDKSAAYFTVSDGTETEVGLYNYPTGRDREYMSTIAVNRAYDMMRHLIGEGIEAI